MEYLLEALIPVVFYAAVLLFIISAHMEVR